MNYEERKAEAARLSALTGREVELRSVDCNCDYWPFCDRCAGEGRYFETFYSSCGHALKDDVREEECWGNESCDTQENQDRPETVSGFHNSSHYSQELKHNN